MPGNLPVEEVPSGLKRTINGNGNKRRDLKKSNLDLTPPSQNRAALRLQLKSPFRS